MPPLWHLDGNQARFSIDGELSGAVDLLRPAVGLELRSRGIGVTAFAVDLPPLSADEAKSQLDVWARDGDLVATYSATDSRPTRGQIYWRAHHCGPASAPMRAIDLIVSVQTHLLDSDPAISVRSRASAVEVLRLVDAERCEVTPVTAAEPAIVRAHALGCFLFRLPDRAGTYVEMVHPSDFTESALAGNSDGMMELSNRLFQGRLEKGVILRSRLRGLLLPSEDDVALASMCYSDFAASEPPLTT
jgi:hypothetical protein